MGYSRTPVTPAHGLGRCTFANKLTATRCEMCDKKQPKRPNLVEVDAVGKNRASRR